jgi:hypothetical protein
MALRDLFTLGRLIAVSLALLFTIAATGAQEMSEADRLERCKNNKARLSELRTQIAGFKVWTALESRQVGDDLFVLGGFIDEASVTAADYAKALGIAGRLKIDVSNCLKGQEMKCVDDIVRKMAQLQDANTRTMIARRGLLAQARNHEVNIVALACDVETVASDVVGLWQSMPVGDVIFEGGVIIEGRMPERDGRVYGMLSGRVLTGKWSVKQGDIKCKRPELGSYYWGRMKIVFDEDRKYFLGDVWSCEDPDPDVGSWKGMRPD